MKTATGGRAASLRHASGAAGALERWVPFLLICLPWLSLAFKVAALAIYKIDLPVLDDWREFYDGIGSLDPGYLFAPHQDTMVPVGIALDSLFARYLNGNVVVYQVLSLTVVMATLLYAQLALLRRILVDRWIVACAFFSTVLMLQPGSYWGRQFLAYHQALPIVCLLVVLHLAVGRPRRGDVWLMALLAAIAGFSYISGAFACVAMAAVFAVHGLLLQGDLRRRMLRSSLFAGVPGVLASVAQGWVILGVQGGHTHREDAPWALPGDADFWLYMLGKFGRAFALPPGMPMLSLLLTLAALALGAAAAVYVLLPLWLRRARARAGAAAGAPAFRAELLSIVFLSLAAAIGVYIVLVCAGRANMRPDHVDAPLEIFAWGFGRFHFFWITVLTPWLVAMFLLAAGRLPVRPVLAPFASLAALVTIAIVSLSGDVYDHARYYERLGRQQSAEVDCIASQVRADGKRIACPRSYPGNLTPAYVNAAMAGLSFARYLPPPSEMSFKAADNAVAFRLASGAARVRPVNADFAPAGEGTWRLAARADAQLHLPLGPAVRSCRLLQVTVDQANEAPSALTVFYRRSGDAAYAGRRAESVQLAAGRQRQSLFLRSETGFADELRVDPVANPQEVVLHALQVGCLRRL